MSGKTNGWGDTDRMRAVVISRPGGPEVLQLVERERPVAGEGEVLIRVHAAGMNRIDILQRQGVYPMPADACDVFGVECSGIIEGVGPDVTRFKRGDRVMALVTSGAQAEWAVAPQQTTLPVPDHVSLEEAAALPEALFTVWTNVFERAGLKRGETILIHGGTSGIGTMAMTLAKAFGAKPIVTAGSEEKCSACVALGAEGAIDYRRQDFVTLSREMTGGSGPDVILDMVGGDYVNRNLEAIAFDGRIAQIASARPEAEINLALLRKKRIALSGSSLRSQPLALKAKIAASLETHVLPLLQRSQIRPVMDSVFSIGRVADAHAHMDGGDHIGKIVLVTSDQPTR